MQRPEALPSEKALPVIRLAVQNAMAGIYHRYLSMLIDYINGGFEALSGFFVLNHCRVLMRDKAVAGVSITSVCFFTLWGIWNLYYYPSLGQMLSFYGGLFIVSANAIYIYLLIKYSRKN